MTAIDLVNDYMQRLRTALVGVSLAERQDILDEIHAHIRERLERGMPIAEVLERLGPAEELAAQYANGVLTQRASRSFSPFVLLRTAFRWSMTGAHGIAIFYIALIGYVLGGGFLVLALLKPLFPESVGLYVGPDQFGFGFREHVALGSREVLGPWFTQVTLILGTLFIMGTTWSLRRLLGRMRRWKALALGTRTRDAENQAFYAQGRRT